MPITIAISGINAIDNPGPGTSVARCLKESELDVRIVGLAYDVMEPGIYMDWLIDKSYILPYPSGDSAHFRERLAHIHSCEKLNGIIPCLDVEQQLFANLEAELDAQGIRLMVPSKEAFRARSKERLGDLAARIGLKMPRTIAISEISGLEQALKELSFPVMIKGRFYDAVKAETSEQSLRAVHEVAQRWGFPVLIQEFVAGDEYNLTGLGDGTGAMLGMVAIKKMMITKLGKIWITVSIQNASIFEAAVRMVQELKWRGGFELELVRDAKSGNLYLIEINPRFPAWIYMAKGCGINLPERMVKSMLGLPFPTEDSYEAGKVMIRYTAEMIRSVTDLEKLTIEGES